MQSSFEHPLGGKRAPVEPRFFCRPRSRLRIVLEAGGHSWAGAGVWSVLSWRHTGSPVPVPWSFDTTRLTPTADLTCVHDRPGF